MKVIVLDYNTGKVHIHNNPDKKTVLNKYNNKSHMASMDDEFEVIYHDWQYKWNSVSIL